MKRQIAALFIGLSACSARTAPIESSPPAERLEWAEVLDVDADPRFCPDETIREAVRASGLPWRVRDRATSIEMVLIPAGSSALHDATESADAPNYSYYLGRYELLAWQWFLIRDKFRHENLLGTNTPPRWITEEDVITSFVSELGLRIPTEAEWEFAYGYAEEDLTAKIDEIAWTKTNSEGRLHPVGLKLPNRFGLHDIVGNVAEYCMMRPETGASPISTSADAERAFRGVRAVYEMCLRGGSFDVTADHCRCHVTDEKLNRSGASGVRVVRSP